MPPTQPVATTRQPVRASDTTTTPKVTVSRRRATAVPGPQAPTRCRITGFSSQLVILSRCTQAKPASSAATAKMNIHAITNHLVFMANSCRLFVRPAFQTPSGDCPGEATGISKKGAAGGGSFRAPLPLTATAAGREHDQMGRINFALVNEGGKGLPSQPEPGATDEPAAEKAHVVVGAVGHGRQAQVAHLRQQRLQVARHHVGQLP